MPRMLHRLFHEEDGQDLVEYALLAGLVSIASVVALNQLGPVISGLFESITPHLEV